jgi:GNAT superfamily N-acetyltransferase
VLDGAAAAAVLRPDLVMDVVELLFSDHATFRPASSLHPVEPVAPDDPRLAALAGSLPEDDAHESNAHDLARHAAIWAVHRGDELVAACGYEVWQSRLAHCSVFTHPAARGEGAGRAAASAAVAHALEAGFVAQWRTRVPASRAIAVALGFRSLGAQLRFRVDG